MEINRKYTKIPILLYTLFIVSCLAKFAYSLIHTKSAVASDGINEYLVNYEGGFVRRGLAGEMLYWLYNATGWNIAIIIKYISVVAIFSLLMLMCRMMKGTGLSAMLITMPVTGLSLYFFHFNYAGCRKDPVLLLILIACIYIVREYITKENRVKLVVLNALLSIGILLHEAFVFFSIPIIACIISRKHSANLFRMIIYAVMQLSPSIIVFLLCVIYKGDITYSKVIWQSWHDYFIHYDAEAAVTPVTETVAKSVQSLAWKINRTLLFHITVNFKIASWGIPSVLFWMLAVYMYYYMMMQQNKLREIIIGESNNNRIDSLLLSNVLIFNFLFMLPMFTILSCDFSRSFIFLSVSSLATYCIIPHDILRDTIINKLSSLSIVCCNHVNSGWRNYSWVSVMIFLSFGVPACTFIMYDALTSSVIGTPIGLLLELFKY